MDKKAFLDDIISFLSSHNVSIKKRNIIEFIASSIIKQENILIESSDETERNFFVLITFVYYYYYYIETGICNPKYKNGENRDKFNQKKIYLLSNSFENIVDILKRLFRFDFNFNVFLFDILYYYYNTKSPDSKNDTSDKFSDIRDFLNIVPSIDLASGSRVTKEVSLEQIQTLMLNSFLFFSDINNIFDIVYMRELKLNISDSIVIFDDFGTAEIQFINNSSVVVSFSEARDFCSLENDVSIPVFFEVCVILDLIVSDTVEKRVGIRDFFAYYNIDIERINGIYSDIRDLNKLKSNKGLSSIITINKIIKFFVLLYISQFFRDNFSFTVMLLDNVTCFKLISSSPEPLFKFMFDDSNLFVFSSDILQPYTLIKSSFNIEFSLKLFNHDLIDENRFRIYDIDFPEFESTSDPDFISKIDKVGHSLLHFIELCIPNTIGGAVILVPDILEFKRYIKSYSFIQKLRKQKRFFNENELKEYKNNVDIDTVTLILISDLEKVKLLKGVEINTIFILGINFYQIKDVDTKLLQSISFRQICRIMQNLIKTPRDYSVVVLLDKYFTNKSEELPKSMKNLVQRLNYPQTNKNVKKFFLNIIDTIPHDIKMMYGKEYSLVCSKCDNDAIIIKKLTNHKNIEVEKSGFLDIIGVTKPCNVHQIQNTNSIKVVCNQGQIKWISGDSIGYTPLVCECKEVIGVICTIVSIKTKDLVDKIWIPQNKVNIKKPLSQNSKSPRGSQTPQSPQSPSGRKSPNTKKSPSKGQVQISFSFK